METRHQITLYNQVTPQIITNSVVETSFFNDAAAIGSRNIAEWFDAIGKTIRCVTRADFTCVGNPTNTIRIKLGGVIQLIY